MSEDQAFYEHCNTVSADAEKPSGQEEMLWEIFRLGEKAGVHYRIRYFVDQKRDEAARLIKELCEQPTEGE